MPYGFETALANYHFPVRPALPVTWRGYYNMEQPAVMKYCAAGCQPSYDYPFTPASDIMTWSVGYRDQGEAR